MTSIGAGRVVIIAFDGIVADTLPLRAKALADAIARECTILDITVGAVELQAMLLPRLPGRTLQECATAAVTELPVLQHERLRHDLTAHDLIAMRAQNAWSATVAHGIPLREGVGLRIATMVARGVRVVMRSDSHRREVEPILRLASLEDSTLFVRCADDLPHRAGVTSLRASFEAIDTRLERQRLPREQRDAVEVADGTAAFALGFSATSRTAL